MDTKIEIPQYKLDQQKARMSKRALGVVACWNCFSTRKTLKVIRDSEGKKTRSYTCGDCEVFGTPKKND